MQIALPFVHVITQCLLTSPRNTCAAALGSAIAAGTATAPLLLVALGAGTANVSAPLQQKALQPKAGCKYLNTAIDKATNKSNLTLSRNLL